MSKLVVTQKPEAPLSSKPRGLKRVWKFLGQKLFGSPTKFAVTVAVVYFAVAMFGALHHEMWNDEFQAWLIARDSANLSDLLSNIRYEGSGPLWYLLLYPLAHLDHNPVSMQILHVAIATACVYLVTRYAPFAWYQKLLLPLGYFFLFEYSLISRSYVLGNLFVFLFCAAYQHRKSLFVLYGLLVLLALTNVFSAIFSVALGIGLLVDRFNGWAIAGSPPSERQSQSRDVTSHSPIERSGKSAAKKVRVAIVLVSFVVALSTCVLFMIPPRDGYMSDWKSALAQRITFRQPNSARDFTRALGIPLYSYVPIPATNYYFWETSIFRTDFYTLPWHWLALSIVLMLSFSLCLRSFPFAASSYVFGTLAVIAFSYLVLTGAMRHFGQTYILLVACLWIAGFCRATKGSNGSFTNSDSSSTNTSLVKNSSSITNASSITNPGYSFRRVTKFGGILFTTILALQAGVGIFCYSLDLQYPFSNSKTIVDYLKRVGWEDEPICAYSINGVGICALLDRSVYQFNDHRKGTFWQSRQEKSKDPNATSRGVIEFSPNVRCILVTNTQNRGWTTKLKIHFYKKFNDAIVPTETRYLYIVSPRRLKTH